MPTYLLRLARVHQRRIDQVLTSEPDLRFVDADDLTHYQVIRAVIPQLSGAARQGTRLNQDMLVRFEQPRDLHGYFLPTVRWGLDLGEGGDVSGHCDRYAAQSLNPLSEFVDELEYLTLTDG
jgi:hypothetical protein